MLSKNISRFLTGLRVVERYICTVLIWDGDNVFAWRVSIKTRYEIRRSDSIYAVRSKPKNVPVRLPWRSNNFHQLVMK